jgi:hypothetical protein
MQLFTNNASSTLASSITSVAATLDVASGAGSKFPTITGSDFFVVTVTSADGTTQEIVKVTAAASDTFSVTRAQEGTSAAAFSAGATVKLLLTAGPMTTLMSFLANAALAAIGLLTPAANKMIYFTSSTVAALADLSSFGRSLIDDADAAAARTTLGLGTAATLASDTDVALTANSDTRIATQKAVKAYVASAISGGASDVVIYKGAQDCSANPNYPAADAGALYFVSVAGKIGGASGITVEAGDMFICKTDSTASGDQATVGAQWNVIQTNIVGAALTSGHLGQFASTTSAQLLAVMSDETGTGALVFGTGPTLSNPVVGTQAYGDSSTKGASTAFVQGAAGDARRGRQHQARRKRSTGLPGTSTRRR